MEIRTNQLEASSSSGAITTQTIPILQHNHPETITESRPIRSSARVRAAKQKAAQLSAQPGHSNLAEPTQEPGASSSTAASTSNARITPVKATRSRDGSSAKGKAKEDLQELSRPSKRHVLVIHFFKLTLTMLDATQTST